MTAGRSLPFSSGEWTQLGSLCSAAALAALHLLQPGRASASSPLGAYALGAGGFLAIPAFLGLALALAGAALGSLQTLRSRRLALLSAALLGLGATATAIAGVFPSDGAIPPAIPGSRDGWVHLGASLAALPFYLLGPLAFTRGTRADPRWEGLRTVMTVLVAGLGGAVLFLTLGAVPLRLVGAGERVLAVLLLAWLFLTGRRIRLLRHRVVEGAPAVVPG